MTQSVLLKNSKSFKIPEGYHIEIIMDCIDNEIDDEFLKYAILLITNDSDEILEEDIKERHYVLSDVLSYGDDLEGCP